MKQNKQSMPSTHESIPEHPLRILYPINTEFPGFRANAIQIANTAHAMARAGAIVHLVIRKSARQPVADSLRFYGLEPHPGLHIHCVPVIQCMRGGISNKISNASFYPLCFLICLFLILSRQIDLIFVRSMTRRFNWLFLKLRDWAGLKLAYEVHEIQTFDLNNGEVGIPVDVHDLTPEAAKAYGEERTIFNSADGFVFISHGMIEFARRLFTFDKPVCTVHDGTSIVPENAPDLNNERLVVYSGHLMKTKGVDLLIDAMALLPQDVRLLIVGGPRPGAIHADYGHELEWLSQRAEQAGLGRRVTFTGYVPPNEIPQWMRKASVLVTPMRRTAQTRFSSPLKIFEYMASGKPIIASDLEGVMEILHHERNALLFRAEDASDLAEKIRQMLSDTDLQFRLANQALEDVREYSWENRGRKIVAFLRQIILMK